MHGIPYRLMSDRLSLDNHDLPLGHIQKEHERNSSNHQNGQEDVKGRQKKSYQLQPLTQKPHRSSSQVNFVVRVSRHKRRYGLKRADGTDQLRGSGALFLSGMVFTIVVTLPCSSISILTRSPFLSPCCNDASATWRYTFLPCSVCTVTCSIART